MKKITFILAVYILTSLVSNSYAESKIDPFFHTYKKNHVQTKSINSEPILYDVFIKTSSPEKIANIIKSNKGKIKLITRDIITALVSDQLVDQLKDNKDVVYIEAPKPLRTKNDIGANEINAYEVHNSEFLPGSFTGRGVIIGVVDSGLDYRHEDFLDENGEKRVLYIWDQNNYIGPSPSEIENGYGTECNFEDIKTEKCISYDKIGHGTHVAGTALARNEKYSGVAPDANLIFVGYSAEMEEDKGYIVPIYSTHICEAAYYIFKKADELQRPAVVNLSLGTHIGPHDGTSLFEQCLDSLVTEKKGRAIVAASGNENSEDEYYTGVHAGTSIEQESAANFEIKSFKAGKLFYIDIWAAQDSDLSFALRLSGRDSGTASFENDHSAYVEPGETLKGYFFNRGIEYNINATEVNSPLNGKNHIGITIDFLADEISPEKYSFDLLVLGKGSFDAWLYPDNPPGIISFTAKKDSAGIINYLEGDRVKSITIPSTAANLISVAGYVSRNQWNDYNMDYELGNILGFSSRGPTPDEERTGIKPEIAAPGGMIASTKSLESIIATDLLTEDGKHFYMSGTSMAAPFVTGTVALMFSVNPNLNFDEIKDFLIQTAYVDSHIGDVPNNTWGFGKLDSLAAVEMVIDKKGIEEITFGSSAEMEEATLSGSCNLHSSINRHKGFYPIMIFFVLLCFCNVLFYLFCEKILNPKS